MSLKDDTTVTGPVVGDLAGAGQIINSEVAKRSYDDALAPSMQQFGELSRDTLKALRLFTAPLQLAAAYQDRLAAFCERVRERVPEERQREAAPEIATPVMRAIATTSDDSPLMSMFEELMAKAIDVNESETLSPTFPDLIKSLSPFQAKLIKALSQQQQLSDVLFNPKERLIVEDLKANFDFADFGGRDHHLTLCQDLEKKNLATMLNVTIEKKQHYPELEIPSGLKLQRNVVRLSMFGQWFANACVSPAQPARPKKPR